MSIIGGTVVGAGLCKAFAGRQTCAGVVLIGLAGSGFAQLSASEGARRESREEVSRQFRRGFVEQIKFIRKDRVLWLATVGNTYFFALAALIQFLLSYTRKMCSTFLIRSGAVIFRPRRPLGSGWGSYAAGCLSGGQNRIWADSPRFRGHDSDGRAAWDGAGCLLPRRGGFVAARFLWRIFYRADCRVAPTPTGPGKQRGRAGCGQFTFVCRIFAASGIYCLLTVVLHLSPSTVFLLLAAATLAGTIYIVCLLPDALLRFVLWALTRTIYRVRVEGRANIPEKGGALFVCNHVSFIDALLLIASTDRMCVSCMFADTYELPLRQTIRANPRSHSYFIRATAARHAQIASKRVKPSAPETWSAFSQGQITRIGQLLPFRRGMERIMKDVDAPIIPVAIDGVWGSIFSFEKRRFLWKLPRRFPYPVTVVSGRRCRGPRPRRKFARRCRNCRLAAWSQRREHMRPLQHAFVRSARRHPFRSSMADAQTSKVTFGSALVKPIFLARRLKLVWAGQEKVGLLLPPSVPGALVNFAALCMGKVPVNLNYTLSDENLASCIRQCEIKTVVTSQAAPGKDQAHGAVRNGFP